MLKLIKSTKSLVFIFVLVVILVACQALFELALPDYMSDIVNYGIYEDYEPLYKYADMECPEGFSIDDEKAATGYDVSRIPIFYMKDGFSTIDLKEAYTELYNTDISVEFRDIRVTDSEELFNDVLMPFLNALSPFQGEKYSEMTESRREEYRDVLSILLDVSTVKDSGTINYDTFLSLEQDTEEAGESSGLWENDTVRKLLASCFKCMKHSEYGNVMPIPVSEDSILSDGSWNGDKSSYLSVDEYGHALDDAGVTYVYDEDSERVAIMYDYEIIMCHRVFGYAYKYKDGKKWIDNVLGTSVSTAKERADKFNADHGIDTTEKNWFENIIDNLSFTKTEKESELNPDAKTYEDMLVPDGKTVQTSDFSYILRKGGLMLLFAFLALSTGVMAAYVSAYYVARFSSFVREKIFNKVDSFSSGEYDDFTTASLITRSTNDVNQIQNIFLLILRTALGAPVTIIGGLILSFRISVDMTLVILYPLPLLFIGAFIAAKIVFPIFDVIQTKVDRLTLIMRENLTGIRVIRAFNKQENEERRFKEVNDSLTKSAITVNRWTALMAPAVTVAMNITGLGIIYVAASLIADNQSINIGEMLAIQQYIALTMTALVMLAVVLVMYPRAATSAKRINEVLDAPLAIQDKVEALPELKEHGRVEFKDVSFKYSESASEYILKDISFVAEKGKTTAIVGGTGAGKSSIVGLIPRMYDATSGDVLLDGVRVDEMPIEELRARIGYVPQKAMLFSGTIRDNIRFGKKDATDEEIWHALAIAQSDKFVSEKSGGLDAVVEQGGQNFSGGQKQRLSIARAVVRQPEVFIFDDSFSALDFLTDRNLRSALKEITTESAVIIIAQRIGTILDADNIIVVDNGRIVDQGRHTELLYRCDVYKDICLSQMSKEELGL